MGNFNLTFYEASFHKITVKAADRVEAEQTARNLMAGNTAFAKTHSRGLVRWNVEEASDSSSMTATESKK